MIRNKLWLSCSAPISKIAVPVNTLFEDILNPFGDIIFSLAILYPTQLSLASFLLKPHSSLQKI
ncbi:hypothetical protein [Photobacterium frigidiphilum]|uniref:hypothetical protein n=1 Tax=Photobacterium frigidiphilum TaxID=264736 RepID=UPI0014749CDF|nr:hypothetical protein [Photobacterium frigidiphilum]